MRVGNNPQRHKLIDRSLYSHKVIMPVYIPELEGYYKESFEIFKLSLNSLIKTSHNKTFISVVANGCNKDVEEYIYKLYKDKIIQEFICTDAIGKINSILKATAGSLVPLITITDADVLFLNNWQTETYKVFNEFPKVGYVSPCPSSRVLKYNTENIILDNLFSSKLKFSEVKDKEALIDFANSIGNVNFYNTHHLQKYLTLSNSNDFKCVVGGGHFVGTYRTEVFEKFDKTYSEYLLGGKSVPNFLDLPVTKNGYYRVSTTGNYCLHMGNVLSDKYINLFNKLNPNINSYQIKLENKKSNNFKFKSILFKILFKNKIIWRLFLKYKGLSNEASKKY